MTGDVRRRKSNRGAGKSAAESVRERAVDLRSRVDRGVKPSVIIGEIRPAGRSAAAAALRLALWQVRGELAAAELGGPSKVRLRNLRRQRHALLEIHASVDPAAHARLLDLLKSEHPAINSMTQYIRRKPPGDRTPADFSELVELYKRIGASYDPRRLSRKRSGRAAERQEASDARMQVSRSQLQDGISEFRTSAKIVTWHQTLRREHLHRGLLPIPTGVKVPGKRAGLRVSLGLDHKSHTEPGRVRVLGTRVSEDGSHLILEPPGWPADFFTGIVVEMSWIRARGTFVGRTHELDGPLVVRGAAAKIDGHHIGHRYDPQVITRETAPGGPSNAVPHGLSDTDWVLRALQILGYLDAEGRAVLAEDSLERTMVRDLGFPRGQVHRITQAVAQLIGSGLVSRVKGSVDSRGNPVFPPVPGRTPVTLLSFSPFVPTPSPPKRRKPPKNVQPKKAQTVSGFVRRLPAGHSPSDEALDAHEDARRTAELANREPLKPGYTFVRRHRRNVR